MIYLTFFCTIILINLLFFSMAEDRKKRLERRLKVFLDTNKDTLPENEKDKKPLPLRKRILYPFLNTLKTLFIRKLSSEKEAKIEVRLLQAGNPFGITPIDYRLFQILLLLILPTGFGLLAKALGAQMASLVLIILMNIALASFIPGYYLKQKTRQRCLTALKELPDVVDLLTVSLEAGLGFDAALSKVISKKNGVLSGEFHRCLEEIRLGKTRRDALKGIQERLLIDELNALINSILQAEKLGISIVHILRIQSHEIRQQRKQRAEEAAMKTPIKMLFPLVLFIFPSLFIVLLGPALLQFISIF